MQISRDQFAEDTMHIINEVCRLIYGLRSSEDIEKVFGISMAELMQTLNTIVAQLPEEMFDQKSLQNIKDLEQIFAKEFIFFQIQENAVNPTYQRDLNNFVSIFSRDIHIKLQSWQEEKFK